MRQTSRIVIVEDEPDLAQLLAFNLERAGYQTAIAVDGSRGLQMVQQDPPDLVILDLMLPGLSGLDVARKIRTDPKILDTPILMLTAKAQETDQVAGLETGADDYMTKPFSVKILLARVEAILRRRQPVRREDQLTAGSLVVNLNLHEVTLAGNEIKLTLTEFRLLVALIRAKGKAMTREDLMYSAIGPDIMVTARTIDVHIASIRKKLRPGGPRIRTVRGVGYLLEVESGAVETDEPSDP